MGLTPIEREVTVILVIIAVVLLAIASFQERVGPIHLGWLGLALWALSTIVEL